MRDETFLIRIERIEKAYPVQDACLPCLLYLGYAFLIVMIGAGSICLLFMFRMPPGSWSVVHALHKQQRNRGPASVLQSVR